MDCRTHERGVGMLNTPYAVSYTHLDVYKRQEEIIMHELIYD